MIQFTHAVPAWADYLQYVEQRTDILPVTRRIRQRLRAVAGGTWVAVVDSRHLPVLSALRLSWPLGISVSSAVLIGDDALTLAHMLPAFARQLDFASQPPEPPPKLETAHALVHEWAAVRKLEIEASRMYQRRDYKIARKPQAVAAYDAAALECKTRLQALLDATALYIEENPL